jgi:O-antigen/teichoic acid export membrane protein
MSEHLQKEATRAFIWDLGGLFAKQGVAFIVSIFLARLLLPEEFGLVAMAMVFISISQIFSDFGLASALIQNKDNTFLTYSSVFFFNVVVGVFLFLLFWSIAPSIGRFYGNPEIGVLVRYLAFGFVITSFNQVQQSILRKNIQFKKITVRAVAAQLISGLVAVWGAFNGWGVYALVVQNLLGSVLGTLLLWQVAEWKPRWEFSWLELKKLGGFSVYVFLNYVTGRLVTQLDTLVVGKVFNPTTLGLYNRAASLNSLVTTFASSSISKVGFSVLSKLQDDHQKFIRGYSKMLELVAFASFGLTGILFFAGGDVIAVLFGPNWSGSVDIFQILVLKAFTYPISLLTVSVFWAAGKSKESFWFGNIGKAVAMCPLPVAIFADFYFFLYAVVVAAIVNWVLTNWFLTVSFKIPFLEQCKVVGRYFAQLVFISAPLYALMGLKVVDFPFVGTLLGVLFGGTYIFTNAMLRTSGYTYAFENLQPLYNKIRQRLW